jgi:hypothetical protein
LVAKLRQQYDADKLETAAEVFVGSHDGDAQPCFGDSGGPLLKAEADGRLRVYAVVESGVGSLQLPCDYGALYTAFASPVQEFIEHAMSWVDPCGGASSIAICKADVASRCTNMSEGTRRMVEYDCGKVGLHCQTQIGGIVGCGDNGPPLPPPS